MFPLVANAATMYVQCGNTEFKIGEGFIGNPDVGDFSFVTLTNSGGIAGKYVYIDGEYLERGVGKNNGYSWYATSGTDGKCPKKCEYKKVKDDDSSGKSKILECSGYSTPTDIVSEDGFVYGFNSKIAIWFDNKSGGVFFEHRGNFSYLGVSKQNSAAKKFIKERQSDKNPELWIYKLGMPIGGDWVVNLDNAVSELDGVYTAPEMEDEFRYWFSQDVVIDDEINKFVNNNQNLKQQCDNIVNNGVVSGGSYDSLVSNIYDQISNIDSYYNIGASEKVSSEIYFELFFEDYMEENEFDNARFSSGFLSLLSSHFGSYALKNEYDKINLSATDKNEIKNLMLEYKTTYFDCLKKISSSLNSDDIKLEDFNKRLLNNGIDQLNKIGYVTIPIEKCEDLFSEELLNKIQEYFNIIKIIVPILVIIFGVLDFLKAITSSDADELKKAQARFIKRLIIAVIIFFIPMLVNFVLNLVNDVFGIVNGGNCGVQ